MEKVKERNSKTTDRELIISRTLNAPVELVWEVFTKPDHIKNWWGPNGFTNTITKMEVKPGGLWELVMHGPDGTDYKNKSIYKEVVKHERIVFAHLNPNFTATINFVSEGKKTKINWHMLFETKEQFEQVVKTFKADEGLKQNIVKLEAYLADNLSKMLSGAVGGDYNCTIEASVSAKEAFDSIARVGEWWAKNFEGSAKKLNDVFTVRFGETFVIFKISEVVPNKKIVWLVTDCNLHWQKNKKEWNGTKVAWEIYTESDSTRIDMTHVGLTPELESYEACETGWNGHIKGSLLNLITKHKGQPE